MCLAVPMLIVEVREGGLALAALGDTRCDIDVSLLESPAPGDYVIVHAGFAIETLDVAEANARLELFSQMARAASETSKEP